MNQNCSVEYTATDGNGLQSTSTISWQLAPLPTGNFVIDGGDGSNVSGTTVKQAIANGDPLAITDGNGVATQVFNPVTAADIASVVAATDPSLVFDPATCTWEDPTGSFPTISVCVETETACGLKPTTVGGGLADSIVDNGDGTFTFLWPEGWEVLVATNQTGGGGVATPGPTALTTAGSWIGTVQVDITRPALSGCSGEYSARVTFADFDNTGSSVTFPSQLAPNVVTQNMTDNGGGNWSMELPSADNNDGFVLSNWISQDFQGTGISGTTDVQGESHFFEVSTSDPITVQPRLLLESAVSVTTLCGETLSVEDVNGAYTGPFTLLNN